MECIYSPFYCFFFCFETLHLLIHHGARYKINQVAQYKASYYSR